MGQNPGEREIEELKIGRVHWACLAEAVLNRLNKPSTGPFRRFPLAVVELVPA